MEQLLDLDMVDIEQKENELMFQFKKPYVFEGNTYTELDLTGLEDVTAGTLVNVGKIVMKKNPTMNPATMEMSMEFCEVLASKVTRLPLEFFHRLPALEMMKVKGKVVGFLYGGDGED